MATDFDALLTAIIAHPQEDTPRLAAADWLDENGQPDLAEFIRCQIVARQGSGPEQKAARARAMLLMKEHKAQWEDPLRTLGATYVTWDRGFPVSIQVRDYQMFLENAGRILQVAPITSLDLGLSRIDDTGASALATSEYLKHLTSLDLIGNDISSVGARALAASPYLHHLTSLNLARNDIGDAGAQALADSRNLSLAARITALESTGYSRLAKRIATQNAQGTRSGRS